MCLKNFEHSSKWACEILFSQSLWSLLVGSAIDNSAGKELDNAVIFLSDCIPASWTYP